MNFNILCLVLCFVDFCSSKPAAVSYGGGVSSFSVSSGAGIRSGGTSYHSSGTPGKTYGVIQTYHTKPGLKPGETVVETQTQEFGDPSVGAGPPPVFTLHPYFANFFSNDWNPFFRVPFAPAPYPIVRVAPVIPYIPPVGQDPVGPGGVGPVPVVADSVSSAVASTPGVANSVATSVADASTATRSGLEYASSQTFGNAGPFQSVSSSSSSVTGTDGQTKSVMSTSVSDGVRGKSEIVTNTNGKIEKVVIETPTLVPVATPAVVPASVPLNAPVASSSATSSVVTSGNDAASNAVANTVVANPSPMVGSTDAVAIAESDNVVV